MNLTHRIVFVLVWCFLGLLRVIPRGWAHTFCRSIATVAFHLDRRHRQVGLINLDFAFPQESQSWKLQTLKASYRQLGDLAVELSRLSGETKRSLADRVVYDPGFGLEHYENARSDGRGVLFLTAHIGAWELLPVGHALLGEPLSFLVRPLDNRFLERWLQSVRTRCGNEVIDKNMSLRKVLRRLKEGRAVGMLLDQNVQDKDGLYAPFFGREACTSSAMAAIALKSGAPVVAGFLYPGRRPGHHRIRFHPPIRLKGSGDRDRDLLEATTRFNQVIEATIRELPGYWLWGHRRFKNQPDGTDPYGAN